MSALDRRRVWSGIVESGNERRVFDDMRVTTWLPGVSGVSLSGDDAEGEARARLAGVANYAAWLANWEPMDSWDPRSVAALLLDVRRIEWEVGDLRKDLQRLLDEFPSDGRGYE
jgi:hypothetical protein